MDEKFTMIEWDGTAAEFEITQPDPQPGAEDGTAPATEEIAAETVPPIATPVPAPRRVPALSNPQVSPRGVTKPGYDFKHERARRKAAARSRKINRQRRR